VLQANGQLDDAEILNLLGTGYVQVNPDRLQQPPTDTPLTDADPTWKTYANPIAVYPNTHIPFILYNTLKFRGSGYFTNYSNKGLMETPDLTRGNNFFTDWVGDPDNLVTATLPSGVQYIDRLNYNYAGEYWAFVFTPQMAERGNSQFDIQAALPLNLPQDQTFNQYIIYYENGDGINWYYGGGNNVGGSNLDTRQPGMTRAYFNSAKPADPADPGAPTIYAKNCRFRWRKVTREGRFEFEDRSELGTTYTWTDYATGTTKSGETIEDFMNYWLQNSGQLWQVTGQAPSPSQTTVTTNHNLGA